MANINVTFTENTITVDENLTNVTVTSSISNVTVTEGGIASAEEVRAALGAVSPILYNASTGVFSFDSNASFAGKTTDDLAQGTNNRYWSTTGNAVTTTYLTEGANLYFTNARVQSYLTSGVADVTANTIIGSNVKVTKFTETVYDNGNVSGNVTINLANGTLHKARLIGNITGITFSGVSPGSSATMILQQDNVGGLNIDTSTYPLAWSDWDFVSNQSNLSIAGNSISYMTVMYDGTTYHASVLNSSGDTITINGLAIPIGGSGTLTTANIAEGGATNLYFSNTRARAAVSATDAGGLGSFAYSNSTGVFTYTGPSDLDVRSLVSVNDTGGFGSLSYSSANGVITYVGPTNTEIRQQISATAPLTYSSVTGIMAVQSSPTFAGTTTVSGLSPTANSLITVVNAPKANITYGGSSGDGDGAISYTGNIKMLYTPNGAANALYYVYTGNTYIRATNGPMPFGNSSIDGFIIQNAPSVATTGAYTLGSSTNNASFTYNTGTNSVGLNKNLTITGNLQVNGNIDYVNVQDLQVVDNTITLNYGNAAARDAFITIDRSGSGGGSNTSLKWNETANNWEFTNNGSTYYLLPTSTTDLLEGANLYYTTARANTAIAQKLLDSSKKQIFNVDIQDLYLTSNASQPFSSGYYMPNVPGSVGDVLQLTGANQADWERLTTANVDEAGGNVYFTTARANSAIGAYQGAISTVGNISTTANITAGNLITTAIHTNGGTNLVLNANTGVVLRETFKGVATNIGNINGDGYGFIQGVGGVANVAPYFNHTGTGELNTYYITTGNTTLGSNTITGVTLNDNAGGVPGASASLSNVLPYYTVALITTATDQYPFPQGTYVTSVDVANSTVTFNNPAGITLNLAGQNIGLFPGAVDTNTGLMFSLSSTFAATGSGSRTTIAGQNLLRQGAYGYPATGPTANDFTYAVDSAGDYFLNAVNTNKLFARTKIEGVRTAFQAPRGIIVGNGDLTNRAENDSLPSFGINVLWDGLTNTTSEFAGNAPFTQLLLKQYSDNSAGNASAINSGPRILFTSARGNKNQSYITTYPRVNNELGRITFWAPTSTQSAPSTLTVPAYINAVTNRDFITHNGGTGLYFVASPMTDAANRGMFLGHQLGNTVIASAGSTTTGATQPITFAPMTTSSALGASSNSIQMFNNIMAASNYQWANINYDNPTAFTGSKLSVTNGVSQSGARNGNLVLAIDRNDNGVGFGNKEWAFKLQPGSTSLVLAEDDVIRTTFESGGNVNVTGNINLTGRLLGYDRVYGEFYHSANINPVAADTIYSFPLDTTVVNSDVLVNNTSRINIVKPGTFKIFASIQVKNNNNAADHIMRFWLRKNGVDVAGSATVITPLKLQEQVVSMHWMVDSDGDDYWEIAYYVNDTNVVFPNYAAITSPVTAPQAPPIIVNVLPVGA